LPPSSSVSGVRLAARLHHAAAVSRAAGEDEVVPGPGAKSAAMSVAALIGAGDVLAERLACSSAATRAPVNGATPRPASPRCGCRRPSASTAATGRRRRRVVQGAMMPMTPFGTALLRGAGRR
jgi:hypothetical protein